jgi:hypothetical protein
MRRALDRSIRMTLPLAIWLTGSCGEPKLLEFPGGADASTHDAPAEFVIPTSRCDDEAAMSILEGTNLIENATPEGYLPTSIDHVSDCTVFGQLTASAEDPAQPFVMTSFASSLAVGAVATDATGTLFDGAGVSRIAAPDTGNWLAFVSASTNLTADTALGDGERGIVFHDRNLNYKEGSYSLISSAIGDGAVIAGPAASADGHWLSYGVTTEAVSTLYVYDTWTRKLKSLGTSSELFNLPSKSFGPSMKMSDDGHVIAMSFDNRIGLVTRSRSTEGVLDVSDATGQLLSDTDGGYNITLSDDLRLLIFSSQEQLSQRDTNDAADVYIYDRDSQNTGILDELPQVRPLLPQRFENMPVAGTRGKGISTDGRFVPFLAQGSLITSWPSIGCTCPMPGTVCGENDPEICGDAGTCLTEGICDYSAQDAEKWNLYVYNVATLEVSLLANSDNAGGISDGNCTDVGINGSGQYIYAICASTTLSQDSPIPAQNRLYSFINALY